MQAARQLATSPHSVNCRADVRVKVGILGGTGPQGRGLARRLAAAGHEVTDWQPERRAGRAHRRASIPQQDGLAPAGFLASATLTPQPQSWSSSRCPTTVTPRLLSSLATELAGKIVVDCVNPLGFDQRGPFPLRVAAGSAAEEAQQLLPDSTVIGAFHHVSAVLLDDPTSRSLRRYGACPRR